MNNELIKIELKTLAKKIKIEVIKSKIIKKEKIQFINLTFDMIRILSGLMENRRILNVIMKLHDEHLDQISNREDEIFMLIENLQITYNNLEEQLEEEEDNSE